jgi:hypothetical protein
MRANSWPWEVALNDVINEVAAENVPRENGTSELKERLSGGAIKVSKAIRFRARMILAQRLNQSPINVAARNWLPPERRGDDDQLYVLELVLWGLAQGNIAVPAYWATAEEAAELIVKMHDWNPAFVMAVINNPEDPDSSRDQICLFGHDLGQAPDATSAAVTLLESLETAANAGNLTTPNRVRRRRRSCRPGLTKTERQNLGPLIKEIVRNNRDAWWQLKREIWDLGYQSYYSAQGDFFMAVERAVSSIPIDTRSLLCIEWGEANRRRGEISESNFIATYTLLVLEELVRRARIAAYRTIDWDNW